MALFNIALCMTLFHSVFHCRWLGDRKDIRPVEPAPFVYTGSLEQLEKRKPANSQFAIKMAVNMVIAVYHRIVL